LASVRETRPSAIENVVITSLATFVELVDERGFQVGVAVHPTDPDTAWFVPGVSDEVRMPVDGELVVTRTRDGGQTFDVRSNGLPDVSDDLIYRHAFDIDGTGEQLLMGSTTGNLWWSGDGGDEWHEVSSTLPTIASVSFC
jgi:hypothetical protein